MILAISCWILPSKIENYKQISSVFRKSYIYLLWKILSRNTWSIEMNAALSMQKSLGDLAFSWRVNCTIVFYSYFFDELVIWIQIGILSLVLLHENQNLFTFCSKFDRTCSLFVSQNFSAFMPNQSQVVNIPNFIIIPSLDLLNSPTIASW